MNTNSVPGAQFLSFENVGKFHPFSSLFDGDLGEPFSHVPASPGVIALGHSSGQALVIESCRNMRARLQDHWKGYEGRATVSASFLAYEASETPRRREAELLDEHALAYGVLPLRNRA